MSGRAVAALIGAGLAACAAFALGPLPLGVFAVGMAAYVVVGLWLGMADAGKHVVYLARRADGAVTYVGVTSPRDGADDAYLSDRIAEHLDDADANPFKAEIVPANCSAARRCLTRRGALRSERRRIKTFVAAKRWNVKAVAIHNDVHADRPGAPVLSLAWYLLESCIRRDASWHRPVVAEPERSSPPTPPQPAEVERRAVVHVPQRDGDGIADFQADAAAAVRRRSQAQHPAGDGGVSADVGDDDGLTAADIDRTISEVEGWLAAQTTTPPDGTGRDDGTRDMGRAVGEGPIGPVLPADWDMGQVGHGTDQATDGASDDDPHPHTTPHTHENGATSPPQPSVLSSEPTTPDNAADGGVEAADGQMGQTCTAAGCTEPGNPRCGTHKRAWEAERKRRQRDKRKGKGDPTDPNEDQP